MRDGRRTDVFNAFVVWRAGTGILEQSFAATEQDGHYREMHIVDEPRAKVLTNGGRAATDEDVKATGRVASGVPAPDLIALAKLTFEPVDLDRFPALRIAREALAEGAGAPTALNAANEIAVEAFLGKRIGFSEMAWLVETVLEQAGRAGELSACAGVAQALGVHHIARNRALALLA